MVPTKLDDERNQRVWATQSGPSLACVVNHAERISDDRDALDLKCKFSL
jgi:hypothetical protein